ncbi:MAG: signal peptidase I [Clostridiales Family XIII bacterium]|jgi:signal peptidase I|nr:signal peptidase I [Clostridiales Family XIII bacterium]
MSRNVLLWARDILIALAIALIIMQFVKPTIVRENSMMNTLHPDDYIFLSKQAYRFGDVKRGDIVVFHSDLESDDGTTKNLIKRVIGIAGDTIAMRDGFVYVNNVKSDEPYTRDGYTSGDMKEVTVPEGKLFVMGDNRQHSMDSRDPKIGFVSEDLLIGKAFFRLYPFDGFGTVK